MTPTRLFGDEQVFLGQYHSRSDAHSKIICWAILFDLMLDCPLLARHAEEGKVGFGVNHRMSDFVRGRPKRLDLVIATPGGGGRPRRPMTFSRQAAEFRVLLDDEEAAALERLPELVKLPVGSVHVAVEAKATMTAHQRALPRLYDELDSSQTAVHGAADHAIAAGVAMINHADTFLSPDLNKPYGMNQPDRVISTHNQPRDTQLVIGKVRELPRRSHAGVPGFDALGIVVIECWNDGRPVRILGAHPAPQAGTDYHYDQMIRRMSGQYAARFANV